MGIWSPKPGGHQHIREMGPAKGQGWPRASGGRGRPLHLEACHEARRGHWGLSSSPACAQPPFPSDPPVESVRELGTELGAQTQGLDGQKLEGVGAAGKEVEICGPCGRGPRLSELMLPSSCPLLNSGVVWGKGVYDKGF